MKTLSTIRNSSGLYPITVYWVVASLVVALAVEGWISLGSAIAILGIVAALVVLAAASSELKQIHRMLDGQRHETLERMDKLEEIILAHGIALPPQNPKVDEAKAEDDV